jgi:hypothetical protein
MTRKEISLFLEKNKLLEFSFHGLDVPGTPKSVIITINKIQVRIPYDPADSLEHFKELIDQHYRSKLSVIDPKQFGSFKGFSWDHEKF